MKKKLICVLLCVVLAVSAVVALVACKPKNDKNTLNVVCLDKGYGTEWIQPIIDKFVEENPGYKVKLEASGGAKNLIKTHIEARNNVDDLYLCVGADWMGYAFDGLLADIGDILDDEVDGIKVKDKIATEYKNSVYYPDVDGKLRTYRLPWISATGGIFYNKAMFDANGWTIPKTYDDLVALCNKIVADKVRISGGGYVKPFVYTGQNTDYFDYAVYTWWAQMAGESAISEFTNYSSKDNFDVEKNTTYAELKESVKLLRDLLTSNNTMADCSAKSNYDAQNDFAQGKAAMMFNGDWIYNEILQLESQNANFDVRLMPLPTAPGADAANLEMLYTIGEDQYIAVPQSSIKKDLAKKFIKIMISDFGCKTFLQKANGMLAYKCNYEEEDLTNDFLKNLVTVRNSYEKPFTEFPSDMSGDVVNSTRMLYLKGYLTIWGGSNTRPYENILKGIKDLDQCFVDIRDNVNRNWESWSKNSGL